MVLKKNVKCKIAINDIIEQVKSTSILIYHSAKKKRELQTFQKMCWTIRRTSRNKTLQYTHLEFYKVMAGSQVDMWQM